MNSERSSCSPGFFEASDGLKARGHSTARLNSTWNAKRRNTTCGTGTAARSTRYFAVASSSEKTTMAATMSPIALRRSLRSAGSVMYVMMDDKAGGQMNAWRGRRTDG